MQDAETIGDDTNAIPLWGSSSWESGTKIKKQNKKKHHKPFKSEADRIFW